ncbi:MAG: CRISPR-associated protein Cas5 [Epsilonproteobacteria bacterium]|nr:CRISPR-associated protein Cas5 [Campylobacterota bacterium]
MFAFKIWGKFASFRDPLTISQNITLSLPPKTTVGGMMASILGNANYYEDQDYFDFGYSCIILNEVRKKSFSQNYIEKYTSRVGTKISTYENVIKKYQDVEKVKEKLFFLKQQKQELLEQESLTKSQQNKLEKLPAQIDKQEAIIKKKLELMDKSFYKLESKRSETFTKPKPTNRELLLNPAYLIVIDNFKYEKQIISHLQNHTSFYPFYLGNSEFSGNFNYLEINTITDYIEQVDSFTKQIDNIDFNFEQKYSNVTMPLKTVSSRQYQSYEKVIFSDKAIVLKERSKGVTFECVLGGKKREFGCEFI